MIPQYGRKNGQFDHLTKMPPFFRSAPESPKDWTFVNEHNVFIYPKVVYNLNGKSLKIEIKLGYYFGYFDYGYSLRYNQGGSSCMPHARSAERNRITSEHEAIKLAVEKVNKYFVGEGLSKKPDFLAFKEWVQEKFKPKPKQLSLFD